MKILINILKVAFLLFLVLSTIVFLLFAPQYVDQAERNGIFRITRDSYGIPTLHVSTMQQYLYGKGIVFAEDRLFQMTLRAYAAQGRLSQFLGERPLQFDRFMREVNLKRWADERVLRFQQESKTQYETFLAMAEGINDRVASMHILPLEFHLSGLKWENFTINHIFYIYAQFQWAIGMNMVDQYTRSALLANFTKEEIQWILPNKKETWAFKSVPIVSEEEIPQRLRTANMKERLEQIKFNPLSVDRLVELDIIEFTNSIQATNCWAVSGNHTQTGLPLLSNDPHLENIIPSQWYNIRVNLTTNGKSFLVGGGMNAGSPHIYGKNPYYAIGFSVSHCDNQDLYRQKIQGNKYFVDGKWRDLKVRNETILVKTSSGMREDHYQVKETHRGPIIHYIYGPLGNYNLQNDTISLAWTGFNSQWQSFIKVSYSPFIDSLALVRHYLQNVTKTLFNGNIMAITADNHILMQQAGIHPLRRNSESGNYIKDGTTTEHDWVGIVPAEDRMHIMDPPKGYIIHANNRVAESGYYGGYLDHTIYTARADRLEEVLQEAIKSGKKINDDFAKKVLMDTVDVYCRQILPQIMAIIEESKPILGDFDCNFTSTSHIASIYQVFLYELHHLIKPFSPQKMSLASFHHSQQAVFNHIHHAFQGNTTKHQIAHSAWKNAFAHLQGRFGTKDQLKWIWGKLHVDVNKHVPFRNSPMLSYFYNLQFPGVGNSHTLNVGKMQQLQFGNFQTTHRANTRYVYGFGKAEGRRDKFVVDTGISENIFSRHYSDQWAMIEHGKMIEVFPEGVEEMTEL